MRREFVKRAFLGETVRVELKITNRSLLPVAWLQLRESLPTSLYSNGPFRQVISLGPRGSSNLAYNLECTRRGYYPLGPLSAESSDVLGLAGNQGGQSLPDFLTVYPKIVPFSKVDLPSFAPMGTLRHHKPVYEDPSRVLGKRDYVAGDSMRRIDWKASASTGRMQVKIFEPSIALETSIFVNLNAAEFQRNARFSASELAIIVAASMANWVVSVRQSVGLATNGVDDYLDGSTPPPVPPRRGRSHLLRILETLARIQVGDTFPLAQLLSREAKNLSWGATLIVISNYFDDILFDSLFQARRSGLNAILVQCGPSDNYQQVRRKAHYFGFPFYQVLTESDLDMWRR